MSICTFIRRLQPAASGRPVPRERRALLCGLVLVLAGLPAIADAQIFFPADVPVQIYAKSWELPTALGDQTVYQMPLGWGANWTLSTDVVPEAANGYWGSQHVREDAVRAGQHTILVPNISIPGNPGNLPQDWTNIRMEFDFAPSAFSAIGAVWAMRDPDADGQPDDGYLFFIDDFPSWDDSQSPADGGQDLRAWWHFLRLRAGTWIEVATGKVELDLSNDDLRTAWLGAVYRLRIDYFCDDLRVQIQRVHAPSGSTEYQGCGGACPSLNPDDCWCTLLEWVETNTNFAPGFVGLYHAGTSYDNDGDARFDNLKVSSWQVACSAMCTNWDSWFSNETRYEPIALKYLYDAALFDYSVVDSAFYPRVDVATTWPGALPASFCDGWSAAPRPVPRMVDLPAPTDAGGVNLPEMDRFLQPMATAVDLVNDGGSPYALGFQDNFDNSPFEADGVTPNPAYNPIPLVADGTTPIADSLMDAYDWYLETRETEPWASDALQECRLWYVILITDGEESCAGLPDEACQPGEAAELFGSSPAGHPDWEPVPIFTIGFSAAVAADSPLRCVADQTGGLFKTAANASELNDALLSVLNSMVENQRSFSPFKVAPPPSPSDDDAFLAVYPFFVPRNERSIWDGTLYAFKLDQANPTLPVTGDCEIDFSQVKWDAADVLAGALDDFTVANAERYVFMGGTYSGSLQRYNLGTIPTDTDLQDEFKTRLGIAAGVTNLQAQEIVNFVRDIWVDDDGGASPDPVFPPRPEGLDALGNPVPWGVLGDFYHSQPVIVNPPNSSMFYFDFGYGGAGGAHDYRTFREEQSKRRRVTLAGANDGLLHAFDAGFYDRDETNYDNLHDLGSGVELFAYLPHAVMDRLYGMAIGQTEQQYMVDGQIAKGDVFIDFDADGNREWRTVAIATMRRGGRGVVALDITQPDPTSGSPDYLPTESTYPGCFSGTTSGCSGDYPRVIWELADTTDTDTAGNPGACPAAPCDDYFDLGWTWSKPAIARIAYYDSGEPDDVNDVFIAFFGGGWDRNEQDRTGNFLYGVNIENGDIVYKSNIGVAVPGSPTALDSDIDGFHDRIYFGDSDGRIFRIQFPKPTSADWSTDGAPVVLHGLTTPATIPAPLGETALYDFRSDFASRQQFFTRPVTVPALFNGSTYTWAVAFGTGNRADLADDGGSVDHFFFVLDNDDTTTRDAADLLEITLDGDGNITDVCGGLGVDTALDPANGSFGWYLTLRANEKVNFDAKVINGHVLFPTFDPSAGVATHNVPDQCGTGGIDPTADDDGDGVPNGEDVCPGTPPDTDVDENGCPDLVCAASGIGRAYDLWYECGMGDYSETNDVVTGSEDYTIGGTTYVDFTGTGVTPPESHEFLNARGHIVTNWRQE